MRYGLTLAVLGAAIGYLGCQAEFASWIIVWAGISFLLAGLAYCGLGVRVFGKRPDGTIALFAVLLLWPFLMLTWGLWHLQRILSREDCCNEVAPGLWLGRRAYETELPPDVDLIVDLTAEFPEPRDVIAGRTYWCLPTLDAVSPDAEAFRTLVEKVAAWTGPAYIHCALGHGRSATVMIAVLIAKGEAADLQEAESRVKQARPGSAIHPGQRRLLEQSDWLVNRKRP